MVHIFCLRIFLHFFEIWEPVNFCKFVIDSKWRLEWNETPQLVQLLLMDQCTCSTCLSTNKKKSSLLYASDWKEISKNILAHWISWNRFLNTPPVLNNLNYLPFLYTKNNIQLNERRKWQPNEWENVTTSQNHAIICQFGRTWHWIHIFPGLVRFFFWYLEISF